MDEERRKRTRRTTLDELEEGRFTAALETIESEGAADEESDSSSDEDDFEFSDDDGFLYAGTQCGLDFWEDDECSELEMEEDDVDPDQLSYEELIALGEMVGVENRGLSEAEITKHLHPITCKSTSNLLIDRCVICQVEYEVGEDLVSLKCDHLYHRDCVTKWLQINKICPICNTEVSSVENSRPKEEFDALPDKCV